MAKKSNIYIFHVQIVNKGVKCYANMSVMCDLLKMKESPQQLSSRAKATGGYPVVGYSTLAKSLVVVTKLLVESRQTNRDREYIKLERHYDVDYISPDDDKILDISKKSLREI